MIKLLHNKTYQSTATGSKLKQFTWITSFDSLGYLGAEDNQMKGLYDSEFYYLKGADVNTRMALALDPTW